MFVRVERFDEKSGMLHCVVASDEMLVDRFEYSVAQSGKHVCPSVSSAEVHALWEATDAPGLSEEEKGSAVHAAYVADELLVAEVCWLLEAMFVDARKAVGESASDVEIGRWMAAEFALNLEVVKRGGAR